MLEKNRTRSSTSGDSSRTRGYWISRVQEAVTNSREGKYPFRTTCRLPSLSTLFECRSRNTSTSFSKAACSILLAPSWMIWSRKLLAFSTASNFKTSFPPTGSEASNALFYISAYSLCPRWAASET